MPDETTPGPNEPERPRRHFHEVTQVKRVAILNESTRRNESGEASGNLNRVNQ